MNRSPRLLVAAGLVFLVGCHASNGDPPPPANGEVTSPPDISTTGASTDAPPSGSDTPSHNPDDTNKPPTGDVGPLATSYADYAINHVISTGQSNSVANGGDPVLDWDQPYTNLMFDSSLMTMRDCNGDGCYGYQTPSAFVPLTEGASFFDYPVETASSGIANQVSRMAIEQYQFGKKTGYPTKHDVLVSVVGRSGNTYWCLRKGSCGYHDPNMLGAFEQSMLDVDNAKKLADAQKLTYAVRAVTSIHGESDHHAYTIGTSEFPLDGTDGAAGKIKDYADALVEWQADYEAGVKAITAQKVGVPLLVSQLSGWNDTRGSALAQMQLDAHVKAPGKVVLVTPGYMLSVREDCLHYDSTGERRLGEYFAKAYAKIVFSGQAWEPLRPTSATVAGNVVTVKFLVPKPPMVLDTDRVSDPGNYGFDFTDDAGTTITKVELAGADTVKLTLSAAPGANGAVHYAQNQEPGTCIGPGLTYPGGARGNLRDSDDTPSQYGDDLYNWAVNFDLAVK
jgi:hypothetical protein